MENLTKSQKIARLNDQFRRSFTSGKIAITQGIHHLPEDVQQQIFQKVRTFTNFNKDNDPYGEHDFGSFTMETNTIFWKIDCYDLTMQYYSPDPTDPEQTIRVLTIMMADEY